MNMRNYDKQLAKYARQLENPKYYEKIIAIIDAAEKHNYIWKDFNIYDLHRITGEICAYYDAVPTDEEHRRVIKHCNSNWFLISDKNYVLWESQSFLIALSTYIRANLILWYARIKQLFVTDRLITTDNVNNTFYLVRGAINTAKVLNCEFWDLEDKWVESNI